MTRNIICVGGSNIDRKLLAKDTFLYETSNPVSSMTSFGGVARNVAENLANWTTSIQLQSVTGGDAEGERLLKHIQALGVDISMSVTLSEQTTAHYYAILDQNKELISACADMQIYDHIPAAIFTAHWEKWHDGSIVFLDTNLPVDIIQAAITMSGNKNLRLCIDPVSIAKAARIPYSLENVFLLKPNKLEAAALTGISILSIADCYHAGELLLARGVQNVVISLGKSGYVIVNDTLKQHYPVEVIDQIQDVNGAGDAFVAGILYGIQQDYSLIDACKSGAIAAALTVQSSATVANNITAQRITHQEEPQHAAIF